MPFHQYEAATFTSHRHRVTQIPVRARSKWANTAV